MNPAPLFADPLIANTPGLAPLVEGLLDRLAAGEPVDVPRVPDLRGVEFVRWLYRQWLGGGARWGPLVHVDPTRCPRSREILAEVTDFAADGWLYLDAGWERMRAPPPGTYHCLRQSEVAVELPPIVAQRIRWLDRFHVVACDPALEPLRRSLLAHCRAGSAIHLAGPVGSGRRSLVRWAHAALDDRRLVEARRGEASRPRRDEWLLCEDVDALGPDQLAWLAERVAAPPRSPPPPPPASTRARSEHPAFAPILGSAPALTAVLEEAERVSPTALPVLILGESGAGKESLARAVHEASGRRGPYVVVDLAAVNENLVESELFGHVRGAYTGADRERQGAFRSADRGTLFLDELGNVPARVQAKLLRALQERVIQPVGDDRSYALDVRIIAATNANLEEMVHRGEFREDLLRRVEAVTLRLPPLRDRADDVIALARTFLARERAGRPPIIGPAAERILREHDWPGNVRELANVMAHAATFADREVEPHHLGPLAPPARPPGPTIVASQVAEPDRRLPDRLRAVRLTVPALRDRGVVSVRAALLALLDGRPIRADAMAILERRCWPGNLTEMEADLAAVRANIEGPVDLAGLRRALPYLARAGAGRAVRLLAFPSLRRDGSVTGLAEVFPDGAVLVGRIAAFEELETLSATDAPIRRRLDYVRARVPRAEGLGFGWLGDLDAPHLLVLRDAAGLSVHCLPDTRLRVGAATLTEDGPPRPVAPGASASVGEAGEVVVWGPDRVYLQFFVFADPASQDAWAPMAARRARVEPSAAASGAAEGRRGVLRLTGDESAALNAVVLAYGEGSFTAHLEEALRGAPAPLDRVAAYVLGPRPTQYCVRLYEHAANVELRRGLAERLGGTDAPLPAGIRRAVEG